MSFAERPVCASHATDEEREMNQAIQEQRSRDREAESIAFMARYNPQEGL